MTLEPFVLGRRVAAFGVEEADAGGDVGPPMEGSLFPSPGEDVGGPWARHAPGGTRPGNGHGNAAILSRIVAAMTRIPFSVRNGSQLEAFGELHDGVPAWMLPSICDWTKNFLSDRLDSDPVVNEISRALRLAVPELKHGVYGGGISWRRDELLAAAQAAGRLLDVIDWLLTNARRWTGPGEHPVIDTLEEILDQGGSKWSVVADGDGWQLASRVPVATTEQANAAIAASNDSDNHLARAWNAIHRRTRPEPELAAAEAINAVEHVLCPLVEPGNAKATLGTTIAALRNNSTNRQFVFRTNPARAPKNSPIDVFIANCELLWNSHPRHGNDPRGTASPGEALAAVQLAVLIVSWVSDRALT